MGWIAQKSAAYLGPHNWPCHALVAWNEDGAMIPRVLRAVPPLLVLAACTRAASPPAPRVNDAAPSEPVTVTVTEPVVSDAGPPKPQWLEAEGNDDDEDPGTGHVPAEAQWEKVGTPPLALTRICDLTPFHGTLYAAHANQPLGTDGATVTAYHPDTGRFGVAFDWNRPGEPTKGGGAGQGFVRVHAIGGRLYVPDADPPYGGLQQVDWGAEGYVFVSDASGKFAPPRAPHFRPPAVPSLDAGTPGAAVLPHAYHVLDAIRFRGALYASTGSVPPKEPAWNGPSPGALHRANDDGSRWIYDFDYPNPYRNGVWRLTYMVRFHDRLYAGIQDYDGRDPNDFIVFDPPREATAITREDAHPTRITEHGASGTLRWWVDTRVTPSRLYWLAWTHEGFALRFTTDGDTWSLVDVPAEAGRPTDITRWRDAVVVLTERGLYRLDGTTLAPIALVDTSAKKKSPFELSDFLCTAPLAVMDGVLYAGGQRGGTLYRVAE